MFKIELSDEAQKDLRALTKKDSEIILKKLYSIKENPLHYLERLAGKTLWKLRTGDYRIIIFLNTKSDTIFVVKLGHRKDIYERL